MVPYSTKYRDLASSQSSHCSYNKSQVASRMIIDLFVTGLACTKHGPSHSSKIYTRCEYVPP